MARLAAGKYHTSLFCFRIEILSTLKQYILPPPPTRIAPYTCCVCVWLLQVSGTGSVLRSEIVGAVKMRVYLSGMPELRLGLNDKVLFESTGRTYYYSCPFRDQRKIPQYVRALIIGFV